MPTSAFNHLRDHRIRRGQAFSLGAKLGLAFSFPDFAWDEVHAITRFVSEPSYSLLLAELLKIAPRHIRRSGVREQLGSAASRGTPAIFLPS